jgi:hypothetical protein
MPSNAPMLNAAAAQCPVCTPASWQVQLMLQQPIRKTGSGGSWQRL